MGLFVEAFGKIVIDKTFSQGKYRRQPGPFLAALLSETSRQRLSTTAFSVF
jgi:hypothetical protein